jgi:hypothetical protein
MMDGKIAIVEEEAELVRSIFRRYLELGSVNELLRDLRERNIRTRTQHVIEMPSFATFRAEPILV